MISTGGRGLAAIVSMACAGILTGCGPAWRAPIYQKPDFRTQWVDRITILPAVDTRIDRSIEVKLDEQVGDASREVLTDKGYPAEISHINGDVGEMTIDGLQEADATWIQRLGPPEARWVMVVGLVDVTTALTYGSTGDAEVAGFLYDKNDGTLAWRDKGVAQVGQGGLIGMAMIGGMDEAAISEAVSRLFASFPERNQASPYIPEPGAAAAD